MIVLEVQNYCHSCSDFEPDVDKPEKYYANGDEIIMTDTVVRCKYCKRCENLKRYLERTGKEKKCEQSESK